MNRDSSDKNLVSSLKDRFGLNADALDPISKTTPRTQHIKDISFEGSIYNNKMERMNGELRDREKVIRGVKSMQTSIPEGFRIHYNFVKPHQGLEGMTPAQRAGIGVNSKNKWLELLDRAVSTK